MRALSTVLLVAVASLTNSKPSGRHNTYIEDELTKYNLDAYIMTAPVALPDTVVNYQPTVSKNITKMLLDHLEQAVEDFRTLPETEKVKAAVKLPTPVHSSQIKYIGSGVGKRSVGKNEIDLDATVALYKQALEFLDKYDVELRMD